MAKYWHSSLACRSSHLTNDAVQEKFDHYGKFEDANKLSMEAFQELFTDQVNACHVNPVNIHLHCIAHAGIETNMH